MHLPKSFSIIALVLLISFSSITSITQAAQQQDTGPVTVVGRFGSESANISPLVFPEISVALVDARSLIAKSSEFVPVEGQILGYMTTPAFPLPSEYRVDLPITPNATSVDLDNDGEDDAGVQVFYLTVASNLTGDSYLQQLEQFGGMPSFLVDPLTNAISEAALLVYAPDSVQAISSTYGDDGVWFTDDDEVEPLEAGYTLVRYAKDGTSTRDRSPEVSMDTMEAAEQASADFSDQGILESFNSLIDLLSVRYAWTDLRGLDWEAIRAQYLPDVEAADSAEDYGSYLGVLTTLAFSLQDAHVSAATSDFDAQMEVDAPFDATYAANVGAAVANISDPDALENGPGDTFVVISTGDDSPASKAGWIPGTEIISIDGQTPEQRLADIPLRSSVGTDEGARKQRMNNLMNFPENAQVTFEYQLPESDEVQTATLDTGFFATSASTAGFSFSPFPINLEQKGSYTYLQWGDFLTSIPTKLAVLEEALALNAGMDGVGMILDMRGNGGGWEELYDVMASYFFTAEDPLVAPFFDSWSYDFDTEGFVREWKSSFQISAPDPNLAYTGPLVVLVNETCASACEYFTQALQLSGRATVIGQYGTAGAGGPIDIVTMPDQTVFQFTVGRSTFAGSEEPNIEAKGVIPDIRVPISLETETAKQNGQDPVLDAAIAYLDEIVEAEIEEAMAEAASPEAAPSGTPAATPES